MKKIFSLFAAVLFAGSMMAADITITAENVKSSYSAEATFTIDEVEFWYSGVMYNGKNSPTGFASKQLLQFRKSSSGAGEIKNNTELNLKTITVATQNDKAFTLSAGEKADELSAIDLPEGKSGTYACLDNDNKDKEAAVTLYTFDVAGKKYFDLLNGANASYIAYIKIELNEGGTTAIDNAAVEAEAVKVFENGQLVIIKNGVRYNALGVQF